MTPLRRRRMAVAALLPAAALLAALAGCAPFPALPDEVAYPAGGVPSDVAWPSDWLEGFTSESDAVGGEIVGMRLEYVDDVWFWRIRSHDPGRDVFDEAVTEPDRGREALVDAATLELVVQRHVTLTEAEMAESGVSAYDAAQRSGEEWPAPRLIELERRMADGHAVWDVTVSDEGGITMLTVE
ncbi:hypothetical protein [Microbacterium gilvum]